MSSKKASNSKYVFLFLVILLGTGLAASSYGSLDVDPEDEQIWMNPGQDHVVNGNYNCSDASASLKIKKDGTDYSPDFNGGDFSFEVTDSIVSSTDYGDYDITLNCGQNATTEGTEQFAVKELKVERTKPTTDQTVYKDKTFEVRLEARDSTGNQVVLTGSDTDFDLDFLDAESLSTNFVGTGSGDNTILDVKVPSDAETGEKWLVTEIDHETDGGIKTETENSAQLKVDVQKPWQADVTNKTPVSGEISYQKLSSDLSSISIDAVITYKGEPKNTLTSDEFYLKIRPDNSSVNSMEGSWVDANKLSGNGKYRLQIENLPDLDLGTYQFEIILDREGGTEVDTIEVNKYITLSGQITDAMGSPVNANIRTEKDGITSSFNMKSKGRYRTQLLPGKYNITTNFDNINAEFREVKMEEGVEGAIRYDEVPLNEISKGIEGVTVVNAVGLNFGYPFEDARIEMAYDPSSVSFENVKVLECKRWNLGRRNCFGEWNALNLNSDQVYPTVGKVIFEGHPVSISSERKKMLSAYMIVRNTALQPDSISIAEDRAPIGTEVPIEGKIETPSGEGVSGVNVNISIVDTDGDLLIKEQATTRSSGILSAKVKAPEKTGVYNVEVAASKDPYDGFETKLEGSFETYIERGVKVQVPEEVEFFTGEETETRFTVVNTGQSELENVKLRVNGLKNDWYKFSQNSWNTIGAGGSREAVMITELPESYCDGQCQRYPEFKVEAVATSDGESFNSIQSIQAAVTKERNKSSVDSTKEQPGGSNSLEPSQIAATGDFLASQSTLNIAMALISLFIISLAAAVKKKKDGERTERNRLSGASSGIQKPTVSSQDEDEEEETGGAENKEEENMKKSENDGQADESSEDEIACKECGESFDTEEALELHKDINNVG